MTDTTLLGIVGQLDAQQAALNHLLDESGGEITDDIRASVDALFAALAQSREDFDAKAVGYIHIIRDRRNRAEVLRHERDRLSRKAATLEKLADELETRLLGAMQHLSVTRAGTDAAGVRIQRNPPSIGAVEFAMLPPEYLRTKVEIDRAALLAALKDGKAIAGARLAETTYHLRFV